MSSRDFMLTGIDLHGLLVMDAGTGAASTTLWLAKKLKEAGDGRIISIDLNPEVFSDAERKLRELSKLVEFVVADVKALSEFYRALLILYCVRERNKKENCWKRHYRHLKAV